MGHRRHLYCISHLSLSLVVFSPVLLRHVLVLMTTLHSKLHPLALCFLLVALLFWPSFGVCFRIILPAFALIRAFSLPITHWGSEHSCPLSSNDWIGYGLLTLTFAWKISCKHWYHHIKLAGQSWSSPVNPAHVCPKHWPLAI